MHVSLLAIFLNSWITWFSLYSLILKHCHFKHIRSPPHPMHFALLQASLYACTHSTSLHITICSHLWVVLPSYRFRAKYHPEECSKKRETAEQALKARCQAFIMLLETGRLESVCADTDQNEALVKLMDAGRSSWKAVSQDLVSLFNVGSMLCYKKKFVPMLLVLS